MSFNPADFGITPEVSIPNLLNARDQYVKLVEASKSEASKSEAPKLDDENEQKLAEATEVALRRFIFGALDSNPILSLVLADALTSAAKDVRDFREWFVADASRSGKSVPVSESKEVLDGLRQWTTFIYNGAVSFRLPIPDDFATKKNKAGDIVPDLPRGPYGKSETASPKSVGGYTLRYRFFPGAVADSPLWFVGRKVTEIPAGTFADEIAVRIVSTPTDRITGRILFDSLPHTENGTTPTGRIRRHLAMPKDGSSVFVNFPSGVLEAWLPVDAPAEVEESDDEATEEDDD